MTIDTPLAPTPDRAPQTPPPPKRRGAAFAVSVATVVVGACVALGALVSAGASAVVADRGANGTPTQLDASDQGLSEVDIDVAAGALTVVFGDVDEARLDGGRGWTFERRGDTLRVSSPNGPFVGIGDGSSATLTLSRELEGSGIRTSVDLSGGTLDIEGEFAALDVSVAGGSASLRGTAQELDLSVAGGAATAQVDDVGAASFEVAGGDLTAELGGSTPDETTVDVTAGSADITLPADDYRVSVDDGLGRVDNSLRTDASATARVDVQATMGQVRLHS